jgi:hypothetical protein
MKTRAQKFYSAIVGAVIAGALLAPVAAMAGQISNWTLNLQAAGGNATTTNTGINSLGFNGESFIGLTPTGGPNFNFTDTGVFNFMAKNGGPPLALGGGQLTANYINGTGTGSFGGSISFNATGELDIYYSTTQTYGTTSANRYGATDGILIGRFMQTAGPGGGPVNADGTPVDNAFITLLFTASWLMPGVWKDSGGAQLPNDFTLGFVTANASEDLAFSCPGPSCNQDNNLSTALGAGAGYSNNPPVNFMVSNGGQLKLDVIPEPGSTALLGIGLLGLIMLRRRAS